MSDIVNFKKNKMYVDFVYCVDLSYCGTKSMEAINNSILDLYEDLYMYFRHRYGIMYLQLKLRIKIIGYGSCSDEGRSVLGTSSVYLKIRIS